MFVPLRVIWAGAALDSDVPTSILDSSAFKALLSVGVVALAAAIALIIAKLASYFYDRKIERKKETQPVDAEAADLVRARLAVMQFKRHRMGKTELTAEEETMRKTIGIWSYKGGKTLGPLKPPKQKPAPVDKTVSGMAAKHLATDTKKERKVAEKAAVESSSPKLSGRSAAASSLVSDTEPNQTVAGSSSSTGAKPSGGEPKETKDSTKPIDQVELVSKINKGVPIKPQAGIGLKLNAGSHNKVGTVPSSGVQEEPPTSGNQRHLESQSSSHGTGESSCRSVSSGGSPRKLFTVVTSSVERKKDLKRQASTLSQAMARKSSDTQSMKSEPLTKGTEHGPSSGGQPTPAKRPTTSHLSTRAALAQKSQSSVGVAILSSNPGKQTTSVKTPNPKVKVKPNTGVGVAKDDTSKTKVAMAGSKK